MSAFSNIAKKHNVWPHPRFDSQTKASHKDIPIRCHNGNVLKYDVFRFEDFTPPLQNCARGKSRTYQPQKTNLWRFPRY